MHLVEEKIGVTAAGEDDELVLDFCRLAGGAGTNFLKLTFC